MRIALTGNPNSGKTTLFNAVTGQTAAIGNWSGVTVSKREAELKKKYTQKGYDITLVDLPGAYSISPYTGEEQITRDYILQEAPDVIINIVDGANVSRSLFFATQLLEIGIPVVVAVNKVDILAKRGDTIDVNALSKELNCPVILTQASSEVGLQELMQKAVQIANQNVVQPSTISSDKERQKIVNDLVKKCVVKKRDASHVTVSDKVDRIIAHKWLGLPIFFLVMWAVFSFSIEGLGGYLSGYLNDVLFGEVIPTAANSFFEALGVSPLLQAVIVDGAIGGVGAVIGFLPLIMVLFFCLSLLEDSGYMARVAVVMDRYFKKIGLSGKSIIPMIVGSGCAIPGVMATRTIDDINEKRMTTILTPFIPCGAKLPIIALFAAVFFPENTWVGPSMYILAIIMILLGGLLLKRIFVWESVPSFFMELPEYKIPSFKHAFFQMLDKAKAFIIKASTIILVCNTLVWFAQAYSWGLKPVEDQSMSILASMGSVIEPILIPLGFVGWQLAAAAITGFIAKENVVATFAVLLAVASEEALHMPGGVLTELFTPVTALAYLAFNLFTPPCFAAMGAMNAEMGSKKWLLKGLTFQLGIGYMLALLITQVGSLVVYRTPAVGFIPAIFITIAFVTFVILTIKRVNQQRAVIGMEVQSI
ncbi:ferrous iron transporter B [Bacillus sp. HMF5848]|uniref:ferrous iron transporter B n=1 Tax=Bacillus sp. HMF5848 TaxID=2495421 RepID=UPI000F78900A|nr:ferrous iron transporter B [Bacillus sp. HMF5848]RSK25842.1 ferrous iron transporter B [Bacillus sp. HMF5848]